MAINISGNALGPIGAPLAALGVAAQEIGGAISGNRVNKAMGNLIAEANKMPDGPAKNQKMQQINTAIDAFEKSERLTKIFAKSLSSTKKNVRDNVVGALKKAQEDPDSLTITDKANLNSFMGDMIKTPGGADLLSTIDVNNLDPKQLNSISESFLDSALLKNSNSFVSGFGGTKGFKNKIDLAQFGTDEDIERIGGNLRKIKGKKKGSGGIKVPKFN